MAFNAPLVCSKSYVLNLSIGVFPLVNTSDKGKIQTDNLISVVLLRHN